jgi:HK97 family phage prohead protease
MTTDRPAATVNDAILCDGRAGVRGLLNVTASLPDPNPAGRPVLHFVASDNTLDRYGEVIEPSGWQLETYRRNPVIQNCHRYGDVLDTLGKALVTEVRPVAGRLALYQEIEFAVEVNPVARIAYGLYRGGFLNAVSVGFIPLTWEDGEKGSTVRRRYTSQELLEVSVVSLPANPAALQLAVRAGAIAQDDVSELEALLRALRGRTARELRLQAWANNLRQIMRAA